MNQTQGVEHHCPACAAGLPTKILVTFYDMSGNRTGGRRVLAHGHTVDHDGWAALKLRRSGGMVN